MVPRAKWHGGLGPAEAEVIVTVPRGGKRPGTTQISISPRFLVPWTPTEGSEVLVIDEDQQLFSVTGTVVRKDGTAFVVQFRGGDISLEKDFTQNQLVIYESDE